MPYRIRAGLLILVALANVLIGARSAYGCDGSDHMDEVIVVGLAAAFLFAPDRLAWLGIVFICAQSLLSYAASGIAKLVSPMWRRGTAVPAILGTTSYGTDRARFVLASVPGLGRVLSVGTIVLECAVPLVLLLPTPMMTAILLAAAAMHIAIAVVMGLNKFLLSWLATYPAIVACHGVVAHAVR
jgi:hypothetical protein